MAHFFLGLNRGKLGISIDLKQPEGIELCLNLTDRMDVLIENFRPGAMDRLGLGYEAIHRRNPRLIYCSISGYGKNGAIARRSGDGSCGAEFKGTPAALRSILWAAGATFLRIEFVLILAGLWTIPAGVYVGLRPRLAAIAQPVAQIAASVPATALFPLVLLALTGAGGGMGIGSIILLLLGTQWYILFNVIAGASAIPTDLKEVCDVYRLSRAECWRRLLLPGIFPYLITGFVTASGGAWNASIVAEYFHFHGRTVTVTGLAAVISRATDAGDFPTPLVATIVMASIVVTINRLLWRRLYALASGRYSLNG